MVDVVSVSLPPLPYAVARNIALYSAPFTASKVTSTESVCEDVFVSLSAKTHDDSSQNLVSLIITQGFQKYHALFRKFFKTILKSYDCKKISEDFHPRCVIMVYFLLWTTMTLNQNFQIPCKRIVHHTIKLLSW